MGFKLTGSLLIVMSCGGIGFSLAASHRTEIRTLQEFLRLLDLIEAELSFRLTPLPQLCRTASKRCDAFQGILLAYTEALESQISPDPKACMETVLLKHKTLGSGAKKYLQSFGETMGMFDLPGQLKQLSALRENCRRELDALEENKDVRLRCYQALGLCVGAALAILFI